jgi:hypothetical protein
MPLILVDLQQFKSFLVKNGYIGALFIGMMAIFNFYFIRNWRLFGLLERENWVALKEFLERRIFQAGKIRRNYVKLLINSYLVASDMEAISNLRSHLDQKNLRISRAFAMPLGLPYLLNKKPLEGEQYFEKLLSEKKVKEPHWIRWNYAFCLLQQEQFEKASTELRRIAERCRDPVLILLSLYLLDSLSANDAAIVATVAQNRSEFRKSYTREKWDRRMEKPNKSFQEVVLIKLIREASDWMFENEQGSAAAEGQSQRDHES